MTKAVVSISSLADRLRAVGGKLNFWPRERLVIAYL
jgi:hypothetical protein